MPRVVTQNREANSGKENSAGATYQMPLEVSDTEEMISDSTKIRKLETMVTTSDFHGVTRSEIGLKYLPNPDFYAFNIPASHCILLTNDGSDLTNKVFLKLSTAGNNVAVLNLPNVINSIKVNAVNLTETTDVAVAEAVAKISKEYGKIGSFIHLHPQFEFQNGQFTQHFAAEKAIVKTVFFLAKHLQKSLNELGKKQRVGFLTVTRMDGQLGQGKRENVSVVGGGLTGLVKCLNLEWSPVFCRAVDIQPELRLEEVSERIIGEFHDANLIYTEVAISENGRKTTAANKLQLTDHQQIKAKITEKSVFLVSGGARGVTAKCVIEMTKAFHCKFILLGRSNFDFQVPDFAKNVDNEGELKRLIMTDLKERGEQPNLPEVKRIFKNIIAKKEIEATIADIEKNDGQVEYLQGDVTKFASFAAGLKLITTKFGNITGIIHGAGRLADKYIQDKTEADFENVLSVKLDGLLSLLQAVNVHQLDHLILFSSVAGFYGNVGQTDYAIANEILSKAAHLFKTNHPNTHVSAINWGAWDSGMVSGELKAQFEAMGVVLVNSEGGPAMLVNELDTEYFDQPQCIIGGTLPAGISHLGNLKTHRIERVLLEADNPFLQHHVIQNNAVLPVVNAVGWMAQSCERLYPDFKVFKVENTRLFKGIVFDGKQKTDYTVELKEVKKTTEKIIFETTILSAGGKLSTYHYKAKVTLIPQKTTPDAPTFQHQISGNYSPTDGAILYQDGSLFHGKYFQGIEQILEVTEQQIVLSCKAPKVPLPEQGNFPVQSVNTFFADIQYQGMVVWVQKYRNGAKSLPLQTDSAVLYREIPFEKKLFVNVQITEATDFKMVATCTVYDKDGLVYMVTEGGTVTVSRGLEW